MQTGPSESDPTVSAEREPSPLPYALGLVGTFVPLSTLWASDLFRGTGVPEFEAWAISVSLLSGLVSACVGVVLRQSTSTPRFLGVALGVGTAFGTLIAGVTFHLGASALVFSSVIAVACAVLVTACAVGVFAAHRRLLLSRPGSLLRAVDSASVWIAAAAGVITFGWITHFTTRPSLARVVFLAGALATMIFVALGRRVSLERLRAALRSAGARVDDAIEQAPEIDLGVGDERWLTRPANSAYRSPAEPSALLRGSLEVARRRARRLPRRDAVSVVAALAACVHVMLTWLAQPEPVPPAVAVFKPPPPPLPRGGSWYPDQEPIVVDLNHDGVEDLVSLRWDSSDPRRALFVAAHDGASLRELWSTEPIPSQWMSGETHLVRSGQVLFLSDSERRLRLYDLATGRVRQKPIEIENLSVLCVPDAVVPALWFKSAEAWKRGEPGVLVDGDGAMRTAARPRACRVAARDSAIFGEWDDVCAKKLRENGGPALSYRRQGEIGVGVAAYANPPLVVGYDPKSCARRWQSPLAFTDEPMHARPHLISRLVDGRLYSLYQLESGRWQVGARDARFGEILWHQSLPEAERGTNVEQLFVTENRVYVARDWRLDVLELASGSELGRI